VVTDLSSDSPASRPSGDALAKESGKQLMLAESGTITGGIIDSCFICLEIFILVGDY